MTIFSKSLLRATENKFNFCLNSSSNILEPLLQQKFLNCYFKYVSSSRGIYKIDVSEKNE